MNIGVRVGQLTVGEDGEDVRKGVTIIFPRHPDEISTPCYAAMHTLNGNGEVSGSYQIRDWGYTNTVRCLIYKQTLMDTMSSFTNLIIAPRLD